MAPQRIGLLVWCAVWLPVAASAQVLGGPRPQATAPRATGLLPRFLTTVDVTHLSGTDADNQFNWDTDLAVDLDVVDVGFLRANIFANVETMVGSERRGVDPNQSGYRLDVTVFFRLPRGELASTFHHVSRHLSDRATTESVSWNLAAPPTATDSAWAHSDSKPARGVWGTWGGTASTTTDSLTGI